MIRFVMRGRLLKLEIRPLQKRLQTFLLLSWQCCQQNPNPPYLPYSYQKFVERTEVQ